jgi:hypothetical protein
MRISEGVNVFQLAANKGTSVEMIESFYGKKRMRDPKMVTEVKKFRTAMVDKTTPYHLASAICMRIILSEGQTSILPIMPQ